MYFANYPKNGTVLTVVKTTYIAYLSKDRCVFSLKLYTYYGVNSFKF